MEEPVSGMEEPEEPPAAGGPDTTAPEVQARLDKLIARVDEELAKTFERYDAARRDLAGHHAKATAEAEKHEARADTLRPLLEGQVFGGKKPSKGFEKQAARYLQATQDAGEARQAARAAYGATLPPGEQPIGQPLGEPGPDEESSSAAPDEAPTQ